MIDEETFREILEDQGIDCRPDNPECEYSEESEGMDPNAPSKVICLAHEDQIRAAIRDWEEQDLERRQERQEGTWQAWGREDRWPV